MPKAINQCLIGFVLQIYDEALILTMPFSRIWIHIVWSTKNGTPSLSANIRSQIFDHIKTNAFAKEIMLEAINGYVDHVHVLIRLKPDQTLAKVVQLLKGESSYWINKNNLTKGTFEWQDEYFAISVSESIVDKVISYIQRQEEHHQKKSFQEEYNDFMSKHGFETNSKD